MPEKSERVHQSSSSTAGPISTTAISCPIWIDWRMHSGSFTTTSGDVVVRLIELHSFQFIGNLKVGPQVRSFRVDRIQWGLEPMRNHAENCFEL